MRHGWIAIALLSASLPARALDATLTGVARIVPEWRTARADGPFAAGAGTAGLAEDRLRAEVEARGRLGVVSFVGTARTALVEGREPPMEGVLNELHADATWLGERFTVGKKISGWGVGFGYRPLDVVQQQDRRVLNQFTLEGVPVVAWERFSADTAWTVLVANPLNARAGAPRDDGSIAARMYRQSGATDVHAVARWSERTGLQLGTGWNRVPDDTMQFYASGLISERHERRLTTLSPGAAGLLPAADPLVARRFGRALQIAAGGSWTHASGVGVLVEAWYDGTAYTRDEWLALRDVGLAQAGLLATAGVPDDAVRGNLARDLQYFGTQNVLRGNVLVRIAYDDQAWNASLDALTTPTDGGLVLTAAIGRRHDRLRWELGVRRFAGPADSAYGMFPERSVTYFAGQWFF